MGKFMKPGKVVMVLAGRYAGRKAVIVKVKPGLIELFVMEMWSCPIFTVIGTKFPLDWSDANELGSIIANVLL